MRIIGEKDYGDYGIWETVDDNGFIYKRRKKPDLNSENHISEKDLEVGNQGSLPVPESSQQQQHLEEKKLEFSLQESEEDKRCRHEFVQKMKVAILQEQKRKYMSELESWQEIVNKKEGENVPYSEQLPEGSDSPSHESEDVLDDSFQDLQVQVEIFEGLVKSLKRQHDIADETLHKLEEKRRNENSIRFKSLMDEFALLKNSPRSLVGSLSSSGATPLAKGGSFSTEFGQLWARTPKSGEPSLLSPNVTRLPRLTPGVSRLGRQSLLSPGITESQRK
ncbi:hypothetical protein R1sor_017145 [Riccia sorocarpa]|uniref:Uncharacterized protein n=1 Tax=Riccia sorocarpa TaxID=122646 RepID=A0ABD3I5Z3_9MARC